MLFTILIKGSHHRLPSETNYSLETSRLSLSLILLLLFRYLILLLLILLTPICFSHVVQRIFQHQRIYLLHRFVIILPRIFQQQKCTRLSSKTWNVFVLSSSILDIHSLTVVQSAFGHQTYEKTSQVSFQVHCT